MLLLLCAIAGGLPSFFAILMLQATVSFWTVETLEIVNTITDGGIEAAQYPLDIYGAWIRRFLTCLVPLGGAVY